MAEALLGGLVDHGWAAADELHVVEPITARRKALRALHPTMSVDEEPRPGVDAVLAVKPDVVAAVLPGLADAGVTRILSIAAGVRAATIEASMPARTVVVRCMPNTPALVGQGAAAVAAGSRPQPLVTSSVRGG